MAAPRPTDRKSDMGSRGKEQEERQEARLAVKRAQRIFGHWRPREGTVAARRAEKTLWDAGHGEDQTGDGRSPETGDPGDQPPNSVDTATPDPGDLTADGTTGGRKALCPEAETVLTRIVVPPSVMWKQVPTGLPRRADLAPWTVPGAQGIRMTGTHAQPGGRRKRAPQSSRAHATLQRGRKHCANWRRGVKHVSQAHEL